LLWHDLTFCALRYH